jgi:hypothetical protein
MMMDTDVSCPRCQRSFAGGGAAGAGKGLWRPHSISCPLMTGTIGFFVSIQKGGLDWSFVGCLALMGLAVGVASDLMTVLQAARSRNA